MSLDSENCNNPANNRFYFIVSDTRVSAEKLKSNAHEATFIRCK